MGGDDLLTVVGAFEAADDVDVVVLGGRAALAFGGVFACVVEAGPSDAGLLQQEAGAAVEGPQRVGVVLVSGDGS